MSSSAITKVKRGDMIKVLLWVLLCTPLTLVGCDAEGFSNQEACEAYNDHMTALPCIEAVEWPAHIIDCQLTDFDDAPDYQPYFECLVSAYACEAGTLISDDVSRCNGYKPNEN